MEKFFEGEPFTTEEIVTGMAAGVRTGQITPVFAAVPSTCRHWICCCTT